MARQWKKDCGGFGGRWSLHPKGRSYCPGKEPILRVANMNLDSQVPRGSKVASGLLTSGPCCLCQPGCVQPWLSSLGSSASARGPATAGARSKIREDFSSDRDPSSNTWDDGQDWNKEAGCQDSD